MDFTNINDPAGVKALLESLRSSQAWAETVKAKTDPSTALPVAGTSAVLASSTGPDVHPYIPPAVDAASSQDAGPFTSASAKPSVADLLSQLRSSSSRFTSEPLAPQPPSSVTSVYPSDPIYPEDTSYTPDHPQSHVPLPSAARKPDVRTLTFQQSLPHLARLGEDPEFVEAVAMMKQEQEKLEKQLWEERSAIQKKHDEKLKVAKTKAAMVGAGLSKHEADMLSDTFRQELRKFDMQRALPAWDGMVMKHQAAMESLGVPTMFVSSSKPDVEKQQRVMQVLEGLTGSNPC